MTLMCRAYMSFKQKLWMDCWTVNVDVDCGGGWFGAKPNKKLKSNSDPHLTFTWPRPSPLIYVINSMNLWTMISEQHWQQTAKPMTDRVGQKSPLKFVGRISNLRLCQETFGQEPVESSLIGSSAHMQYAQHKNTNFSLHFQSRWGSKDEGIIGHTSLLPPVQPEADWWLQNCLYL